MLKAVFKVYFVKLDEIFFCTPLSEVSVDKCNTRV